MAATRNFVLPMGSLRVAERRQAAGKRWSRGHTEAAARQVIDPAVGAVFEVEVEDLRSPTRARRAPRSLGKSPCIWRTSCAASVSPRSARLHLERAVAALMDAFVRRGRP